MGFAFRVPQFIERPLQPEEHTTQDPDATGIGANAYLDSAKCEKTNCALFFPFLADVYTNLWLSEAPYLNRKDQH
jgi:hypothetical protein